MRYGGRASEFVVVVDEGVEVENVRLIRFSERINPWCEWSKLRGGS